MANWFSDLLFGKKEKLKTHQNYTPEQQQMINELAMQARQGNQQAMEYLNSILSDEEGAFEDFEQPYIDQFNEQTVPSIMERLNRGGGMSKGSSALNQTLGQAAKGLSTNLASQRAQLRQSAIGQLQNFGQQGLTQQSTPYKTGGTQGLFGMLAPSAGQFLGSGFQNLLSR